MSKYDKSNTSRLPLIESVIIIAIFAIVSVAIMQLYVSADRIQKKSVDISKAAMLAENRAEELRDVASNGGTDYYDEEWKPANEASACFCMVTELTETREGQAGRLAGYKIRVYRTDKPDETLAELETACYY